MHKTKDSTKLSSKNASQKLPNSKFDQLREEAASKALGSKAQTNRLDKTDLKSPKIPRNVNFYRHLIFDKYSSESDIEWVLKLRSPAESSKSFKMEPTSTQPFSLYGRELEGQKMRRVASDIETKNPLHQVHHLLVHRMGPTPNKGSVQFETGLRSYGASSEKLRALEKSWSSIPKKDRNEFPTLYPSYEETNKIKVWSTKNLAIQTHTGFEGYLSYPKYDDIYDRQIKNVSEVKHLLRSPGQLMSTADWQLSMRQYGERKTTKDKENANSEKSLGELKKISRKPKRV